jgi:hypothetical protein
LSVQQRTTGFENNFAMKKLFYSLFTLSILLAFTACEEKERAFPEYENLEHGAYARQLTKTGNFFLTDVDNSAIDISVEFYDDNDGKNVASYSWVVEYIDKANGGANSVAPVNILTIDAGAFSTNPDTGLPFTSFGFTLPDVLSTLGITAADVDGGSTFRFNATLTLNDGRTFTAANTGSNVISSAPFSGLFSFDANLLCTSDLGGDIDYVTTAGVTGGGGPACPDPITGTISLTPVEDDAGKYTISDASLGVFGECWADSPAEGLTLVDACNITGIDGADQYGDSYTWTIISIDGPVMTIDFENTYGDGGSSVLTRVDGVDWPPLTN